MKYSIALISALASLALAKKHRVEQEESDELGKLFDFLSGKKSEPGLVQFATSPTKPAWVKRNEVPEKMLAMPEWIKRNRKPVQAADDLVLLNFLLKNEEPNMGILAAHEGKAPKSRKTARKGQSAEEKFEKFLKKKRREDVARAEKRYQEIIEEQRRIDAAKQQARMSREIRAEEAKVDSKLVPLMNGEIIWIEFQDRKSDAGVSAAAHRKLKKSKEDLKDFLDNLDMNKTQNKLAFSVVIGVILSIVLYVLMKLVKFFAEPASDAVNKYSLGYERIELDLDEDEENVMMQQKGHSVKN